MFGYATARPIATQITTARTSAKAPPTMLNSTRSAERLARLAQWEGGPFSGRGGRVGFEVGRSASLMKVVRVCADYRNLGPPVPGTCMPWLVASMEGNAGYL